MEESPENLNIFGYFFDLQMRHLILDNGSLCIHSARSVDKGHFLCQATNGFGIGLSKVVHLDVRVPARFHRPFQNITAIQGSSATLDCTADGDKPVSINWFQNGHRFDATLHERVTAEEIALPNGVAAKLEFERLQRTDTARFVCIAANKYGSDRSEILLVVQEPPETPVNFHVSNYSSRSVSLAWEPPYDGNSRITHYVVQYKNTSVTWHWNVAQVLVQGDQQNVTVAGLLPAHAYHFRALAGNSIGTSNATSVLSVTTEEEPPESPPRDVKVRTKSSESLLVTWKPPEQKFQNGEILGYHIGYRESNSSDEFRYKTFEVIPGTQLQGLLNSLRKFTEYSVHVQAYNRAGTGPRSPGVAATTGEDVPGSPPEDVRCEPSSSSSLSVWWSAPATQINGVLQGYRVLYRALSDWDERVTGEENVELADLQSFCNYSVEVRAFTSKGDGAGSRPVFCRTLEDVPDEPADIKALVMDSETILLSWRPPKYPNGILTKYKVYIKSLDGFGLTRDEFDVTAGQTEFRVSHLSAQHRYLLWVSAATAAGEGAASRRLAAPPRDTLSLPCLAVGQPPPLRRWTKDGSAVESGGRVRINEEWQLTISPTQTSDSGQYTCSAENAFGSDQVVYSVTIRVPAAPVNLSASAAGHTSIQLRWQLPSEARTTVQGYQLHYKKEFGEWEQLTLPAESRSWTVRGLQCGSRYQLYLQAFNREGRSAATPTAAARTLGTAPVAPTDSKLIRVNATWISLNLSSWSDGGCPITSVVVEYKARGEPAWTLVSNNAQVRPGDVAVLDLASGASYRLRVTAHNSAGSTVATYDFATLTHAGATVSPELTVHSGYSDRGLHSGVKVIAPALAGALFLLTLAASALLYLRRTSGRPPQSKHEEKPADAAPPSELEERSVGATQTRPSAEGPQAAAAVTSAPASAGGGVYQGPPLCLPFRDVSPYATFQVAPGCPDVVQQSGAPLTAHHSHYGDGMHQHGKNAAQVPALEELLRSLVFHKHE
ncbi:Down syndrome cell adhesion molecule-like protein 1 homolog [Schistocerca americana]|uniref:Down syndrome cell adhesion molecule-like protein 1 homolog n=1 Tax=Schistocerca americana TaxID=7009 RepID=UPI001F503EC4|nr:Down syndrome cell adhesion molecule-like protein 1 homolog [Schistocerca americana]